MVDRLPYQILGRIFLISCSGLSFLIDSLGKEFVSYGLSSHPYRILKLQPLRTIHTSHVFIGPFVSFLPAEHCLFFNSGTWRFLLSAYQTGDGFFFSLVYLH